MYMWQRKFLITTGIIELLLLTPDLLFIVFFGYQGIVAGEMGNMIGIFSAVILLLFMPNLAARISNMKRELTNIRYNSRLAI